MLDNLAGATARQCNKYSKRETNDNLFQSSLVELLRQYNFMVKSIAEQSGVRMPSFFGFFGRALLILIPVFIIVNLIFI